VTKLLVWITIFVCLAGVVALAPITVLGTAPGLAATFFIAHADTHEDAAVVPLIAMGGRPVTFEVRVRDAGSSAKAGWQARIVLDACRFETPSATDVQFGDYMASGSPISVGPKIERNGNRILIDQGQLYLVGDTTASSGLLATIKVVPKTQVGCPDPGGIPPSEATAAFDLALLAAPGGIIYDVTAISGRFVYLARTIFLPLVSRNIVSK